MAWEKNNHHTQEGCHPHPQFSCPFGSVVVEFKGVADIKINIFFSNTMIDSDYNYY